MRGRPGPGAAPSHGRPVFSSGSSAVERAPVSLRAAPAPPLAALDGFRRVRNTAGRTLDKIPPTENTGKAQRRKNYYSIIRFCTFVSSSLINAIKPRAFPGL